MQRVSLKKGKGATGTHALPLRVDCNFSRGYLGDSNDTHALRLRVDCNSKIIQKCKMPAWILYAGFQAVLQQLTLPRVSNTL